MVDKQKGLVDILSTSGEKQTIYNRTTNNKLKSEIEKKAVTTEYSLRSGHEEESIRRRSTTTVRTPKINSLPDTPAFVARG